MPKIRPSTYFRGRGYANIDFDNGVLYYQGENDDITNELDCDESRQLLLAMMNYFISINDKFWEKKETLRCTFCDFDITQTVNNNIYHGDFEE